MKIVNNGNRVSLETMRGPSKIWGNNGILKVDRACYLGTVYVFKICLQITFRGLSLS
jgi:hypothetical protein